MKSINTKLLTAMVATSVIFMLLIGIVSVVLNIKSTDDVLEQTMRETAEEAAAHVSYELRSSRNVAMAAGMIPMLSSNDYTSDQKSAFIAKWASEFGFERGNLVGVDGIGVFDGNDYSDRDYFQTAMKGDPYISAPLISKVTNEITFIIAAPVWQGGVSGSSVAGVVYFAPHSDFLNSIMLQIQVSESGAAYMIDKEGTTIADVDASLVNTENIEAQAATDDSLSDLAAIHTKMRGGESGFDEYVKGDKKIIAYAPVDDTDGWSLAVNAVKNDFSASTRQASVVILLLLLLGIVCASLISLLLSKRICEPIQACTERIKLLATGNLSAPVPVINSKDETGALADATAAIVTGLSNVLHDMDYLLTEMAHGNFDIRSKCAEAYIGDFEALLLSIRNINHRLSDTLAQINNAAQQVSSGSDQVSSGAQSLAQGATEQASAVQELSATINEISQTSQQTASLAEDAKDSSQATGTQLNDSSSYIKQLNDAMQKISDSSQEISKIISTIENIAFQTNILALNAAVEAARAGTAGKGFAVVADEVRNLASKSDQAAKATKDLIEGSIAAVGEGANVVQKVTHSMDTVMDLAGHAVSGMQSVASAIQQQTESIVQITQGVDQISSVVQTNSATAEESAAASEELSGQAEMLKELVNGFTLRSVEAASAAPLPSAPATPNAPADASGYRSPSKY